MAVAVPSRRPSRLSASWAAQVYKMIVRTALCLLLLLLVVVPFAVQGRPSCAQVRYGLA